MTNIDSEEYYKWAESDLGDIAMSTGEFVWIWLAACEYKERSLQQSNETILSKVSELSDDNKNLEYICENHELLLKSNETLSKTKDKVIESLNTRLTNMEILLGNAKKIILRSSVWQCIQERWDTEREAKEWLKQIDQFGAK